MCNDVSCPYCTYKYNGKKQLVIVCAGQSNSVGYGEQFPYTVDNTEGLFQLGLYGAENLKVIPLTSTPQNFQNMSSRTLDTKYAHSNAIKTDKTSYHLQLAYQLREAMDENYDVLVIPIAFGMTGFSATKDGTLDDCALTHKENAGQYSWRAGLIFSKILVERVKFAMRLNPDNIFGGIVWMQGETDCSRTVDINTFKVEFPKLIDYVQSGLAEIADRSICNGSVGKEAWYVGNSTEYWYKNGRMFDQIYANYKGFVPKNNLITIPFDVQYTNANGGDGETSSARDSHFRDMVVVGNAMAKTMIKNPDYQLPYKVEGNFKNNPNDYGTFIDSFVESGYTRISVNPIGEVFCNPHATTAQQNIIWFNPEVRGFLVDNAQTNGDFYFLIKNKDGKDYALLIAKTPDANGRYWQFFTLVDNVLNQIAIDNKSNQFNIFSILRYSDNNTPNFNSTRQAEYGITMNRFGNLLVINGLKSSDLIMKDANRLILANDYCYTPLGTENIEVVDSTLFSSSDLQRIAQFEKKTTNEAVDLRLMPIQFGLLTVSPVGNSTNAQKIGKIHILDTNPATHNYF